MKNPYEARLLRVMDYIYDNPAEDLSLDVLADVAAMSRFHWHRVFHGMTGETCAAAVRRVRMYRAACWLVQKDWTVNQIAKRVGYDNVSSFSRVFREGHGLTPAAFRSRVAVIPPRLENEKGSYTMYPVDIKTRPAGRLAALGSTWPYRRIYGNRQEV
ncbi:AraC family transcriptional regulator [uncultured Litoreibacter sp.]|uniref:AraC family transcriptional regulator n=1 Tax=uncultured Litoreibacter sp. TaxID=1392394 RepID=UPI0034382FE1